MRCFRYGWKRLINYGAGDTIGFVCQKIDGGVRDNLKIEHLSRIALNLDFAAMFCTIDKPNHKQHDQGKYDKGWYLVGTRTAIES